MTSLGSLSAGHGGQYALRGAVELNAEVQAEIDAVTLTAQGRFGVAICIVSLIRAGRSLVQSVAGLVLPELSDIHSFVDAQSGELAFIVADAQNDERFCDDPLVVGYPHLRFYAGVALTTAAGHRFGTLSIVDSQPRHVFLEADRRALSLLASQVVMQLELHRLQRSEKIADLIDATTSDAIVGADVHSKIIHWNRGAEAMFGWSAIEALGQPLTLIVPGRHQVGHNNGMARLRKGAATRLVGKTVEVPATIRDGRELPVELSLARWTDPVTGATGGYAAIIRDVSERKALESERDAVMQRLSEQIAAINESVDGIAITDADGCFTFMNDAHAVMFGFANGADGCGRTWRSLYSSYELARLEQVAFPVLNREARWRGRATGTRLDGTTVEQEISLSLNGSGCIVCVTRDVGARLATERDQILLREQLLIAQRQEALGQIAAGLAHDFNNCIAAIAGSASLILEQGNGDARPHAKRITAATVNAGSLVQKMLALGSRARTQEQLDLRTIVTDVGELLRAGLSMSQRLHIHVPSKPLTTNGDATELMQIILNLGINARDAIGNAPGHISIRLSVWEPSDSDGTLVIGSRPYQRAASIRVTDDGSGITAEDIAHIFEPNYSSKAANGSGLGLAIVARLVTALGGGIALSTTLGAGTTFEIMWPLDQLAQLPILPDVPALPRSQQSLAGISILIAEDDPLTLETLTAIFEASGAEVGPCQRPEDALEALRNDPDGWALLVTDYEMPSMNGAELLVAARQVRPGLSVLLCTALPEAARAHQDKFSAVFAKRMIDNGLVDAALAALATIDL